MYSPNFTAVQNQWAPVQTPATFSMPVNLMLPCGPIQMVQSPVIKQPQPVSVGLPTEYFMYDFQNKCLVPMKKEDVKFSETGLVVPPPEYTAIYTNAPSVSAVSSAKSMSSVSTDAVSSTSQSNSRCASPEEERSLEQTNTQPRRKFPHKSKQIRIDQVHQEVAQYFTKEGCYATGENEVLRGEDTCRVHVKTFQGLNKILDVLKQVHNHQEVTIKRIATPISMKNRFQKKGFIVYMKLEEEKMVPIVQSIFSGYSKLFKKCDIARPKAVTTETAPVKKVDDSKIINLPVTDATVIKPAKTYSSTTNVSSKLAHGAGKIKVLSVRELHSIRPPMMMKRSSVGA